MSFITKRDRVFNDYDLYDLPARNEGKLKAYASCTDARAWSHFGSDKSEHLVDIIKRNNDLCRPKYVPTDAIVNTLLAAKNTEIGRLRRKIEEFEQMLAAYDQLELTCDQKCEIANAHAAIKAAHKELDEMCLDLDLSGYTEGVDSEAFETGKSRGDEASIHTAYEVPKTKVNEWEIEKEPTPVMETKANQTTPILPRDASTSAHDGRIDEMQDMIITKDAKLSAMQNTIAVMENDICEPYCIYAHIYTALEKIFGILCQNRKYKDYLELLTAGMDIRSIDIKGKILFKLKVLEKFSMALIAPCSQERPNEPQYECSCYHTQIETTFALTSPIARNTNLDSKRALLVANIMENQEIKEILSKDSISSKIDDDHIDKNFELIDGYNIIETENLKRLKKLQANYDDLLNCYENLKYEKNCLIVKYQKYEDVEKDFDQLKSRLQEYNCLWNEKEHYRKRSEDLDTLKEKFILLSEETSNIETELKAGTEINHMKCKALNDLRCENISLEKKLNDMVISFEREKNMLTCKLKEYECKMMCQEQQIKSLSIQIDQLFEQDRIPSNMDSAKMLELTDEIEALKQQIKNLQDVLLCDEEEKQQLQEEFRKKLELINDLKMEIEDWKSNYDTAVQSQNYLENFTRKYQDEMQLLKEQNRSLAKEIEEKSLDIEKFISIINNKTQENESLMEELECRKNLYMELQTVTENYDKNLSSLENEKKNALLSLHLARTDSQKLIGSYEEAKSQSHDYQLDERTMRQDIEDNERCLMNIVDHDNENSVLLQEIQRLRADNITNISKLQDENTQNKKSLELLRRESSVLNHKLRHLESLSQQFNSLKESYDLLVADKIRLEQELQNKTCELDNTTRFTRRESETLLNRLQHSENLQEQLSTNYQDAVRDKYTLLSELSNKETQLENLSDTLNSLKDENERLRQESQRISSLQQDLKNVNSAYENLRNDFENKCKEIDNLYHNLEIKSEENHQLNNLIKNLQDLDVSNKSSMSALQHEKFTIQTHFASLKQESAELVEKLQYYENLEHELDNLRLAYDQVKFEKDKLHKDMELQDIKYKNLQNKNGELISHSENLLAHNEELEKALINARNEITSKWETPPHLPNIKQEVDNMKEESNKNHQKIKNLLNKLDESEQIIYKLSEDVIARDDKISLLQNHINELQDEVKRLHSTLADLTESSEQMKDYNIQNINLSLKKLEAHHSKATHNMRLELTKLQNKSDVLENQLSATKLKNEDSNKDIDRLRNERKAIATDIKQLEVTSVGDSILTPNNCTVEDILSSISKIMKCFESKQLKNTSLEKTLLKVQSSFQLVVDKADEEKKMVNIEKQTLLNEKNAAITNLENVEKKFTELKLKYEQQISRDTGIINDLEAEILNQNLIIEKIKKSKEYNHISKLEDEIKSLQKMYEISISKVDELQNTLRCCSEEKDRNLNIIEETNLMLKAKRKEIEVYKNTLENLRNKSVQSVWTQVEIIMREFDEKSTETCKESDSNDKLLLKPAALQTVQTVENNIKNVHQVTENAKDLISGILPKNEAYSLNEVQILRANVDVSSFDNSKWTNIGNKMKKLNYGPVEICSIPSLNNSKYFDNKKLFIKEKDADSSSNLEDPLCDNSDNTNIIDVYNLQHHYINSPQKIKQNINAMKVKKPEMAARSSSTSCISLKTNEHEVVDIVTDSVGIKKHKSDKDLFVIYRDNNSNNIIPIHYENELLQIYNKDQLVSSKSKTTLPTIKRNKRKHSLENHIPIKEDKYYKEAVSNKPKLQIELPRIEPQSLSPITTSEGDNNSLESYGIYSSPKRTNSDTSIKNKENSSNVPLHGSPEAFNKLRHEEKLHDIFLQNRSSYSTEIESNQKLSNKCNENLLIISSEQPSHLNSLNHIYKKKHMPNTESHHKLSRIGANVLLIEYSNNTSANDATLSQPSNDSQETLKSGNFGLQYILNTIKCENEPQNVPTNNDPDNSKPYLCEIHNEANDEYRKEFPEYFNKLVENEARKIRTDYNKTFSEFGVLVKMDSVESYENKIRDLTRTLENIEKDYKEKVDAVKVQYDSNIKNIINDHNLGVKSIKSLHEETLQDVIKIHENEVENLRTMSIEALRKVEKLERENNTLKIKMYDNTSTTGINEEQAPVKISTPEVKKRRGRSRIDTKTLTKTNVEAFNVKPKTKSHGPCTCSIDLNISDTIRNIFEQVDLEQRKVAENTYLKYIACKISNNNIEALDTQELSFLHLKVCRTWKTKLSKEEAHQKRIHSLESELINKQRQAQQHMAELDRKVAEERRRLQEVREAVCRSPDQSRDTSPASLLPKITTAEKNNCICTSFDSNTIVGERRSAGDLLSSLSGVTKMKRPKQDISRAMLARLDSGEKREKKYNEDPPIRLKRSHDRPVLRKK